MEPSATPESTVVAVPDPTPTPNRLPPPSQWEARPTPPPMDEGQLAGENWYRGGLRAMEDSDFGKARDMFARATDRDGAEPRYWEALGDVQVILGDTEAAARSYSRAQALGQAKVGR